MALTAASTLGGVQLLALSGPSVRLVLGCCRMIDGLELADR